MKEKMLGFLIFLAVLAVPTLMPVTVCAGELGIFIEQTDGNTRAILSFDTDARALGAFQLALSYDPRKVQLKAVQPGDSPYFSELVSMIDNGKGIVNISAFQGASMNEPSGNIILARFQVEFKGAFSGDDIFNVKKAEFLSPQGTAISFE